MFIESENGETQRGKPITCRQCKCQFKVIEERKSEWKQQKYFCPKCKSLYCMLPKTEADLRVIQDDFILDKHNRDLGSKFYLLLKIYIRSLILKNFTNIVNDPDDIDYHAHVASTKVIQNYYSIENFKIETSFAAYSIFKIKESIWHKSEYVTAEHSLHETVGDDEKLKFDYGVKCNFQKDSVEEQEREDVKKYIFEYLKKIIYYNNELSFKILVLVVNYIKYGEQGTDRLFKAFGIEGKHRFQYVMRRLKEKLLESNG